MEKKKAQLKRHKNGQKTKSNSKFHEFLEMDMGRGAMTAEQDLELERRLAKKLKVKKGKLTGPDDGINSLSQGLFSDLDPGNEINDESDLLMGAESPVPDKITRQLRMEVSEQAVIALHQLRERLCNRTLAHSLLQFSSHNNFSKLKFHISSSISAACSKVLLLRGDKGSGKSAVVELVLKDLKAEHPDSISVVTLYGLLHSDDDNSALEEIARQLCVGHKFSFSKTVSLDENKEFLMDMLKEYGLARKTVVFVLDEFHLFTQGKQWLLYTLFDAMETFTSQSIIIIGLSCMEGSEHQLEKRVRSRFSSCTLLFGPPSEDDRRMLLEQLLYLQKDSSLASKYVVEFNSRLDKIFSDKKFKEILSYVTCADGSTNHLLRFLFTASSYMDMESGFLSLQSFDSAYSLMKRQPKFASLHDLSVLELYILVCMHRLQCKEETSYNFNSVMKEYKAIQDAHKTSDNYSHTVCLRAFEHLLDRELISFTDTKGRNDSIKFRPVKLLVSSRELDSSLKSNSSCPTILQKLLDHESYM